MWCKSISHEYKTGKEKKFHFPKTCPVCDGEVERKEGESAYRCVNPDCYAKSTRTLYHFVSKNALNIDGLGVKVIDMLIEYDLIKDPARYNKWTVRDRINS